MAAETDLTARLQRAGCVFAEDEAQLLLAQGASDADLEGLVRRREAGEPLEHLLGWAQFCGIRIDVGPGVFVPRRRSELLVTTVSALEPDVVIDLCCGSGAVGAALLSRHPELDMHASDVDDASVSMARRNIEPRGGRVHHGDLFDALPIHLRGRVDTVVVNAPYVPTDDIRLMPPEARLWEPVVALDGGCDGLDLHRRIIAGSREWLKAGGVLVIETSERQKDEDLRMLGAAGFEGRSIRDLELDATVVIGTAAG